MKPEIVKALETIRKENWAAAKAVELLLDVKDTQRRIILVSQLEAHVNELAAL